MKTLTLKQYIAHIASRNKQTAKILASDAPRIGIFWLHLKDGKPKIFSALHEAKELAEDYGSFIVSKYDHDGLWNTLINNGIVPNKKAPYTYLPRGRIAFDKDTSKFVVFTGSWVTSSIKSVIKTEFHLKSNTRWETDIHYEKFSRWGF